MVSYVKVGRLARVLRGPREGKVAFITAIIDGNRVLMENPADEKMWRHVQSLQNIEPTRFAIDIAPNATAKDIKAALAKKDVLAAYTKTGVAKKVASLKALAESTDFERYQLRVAKRSRAHWSRKLFAAADAKKPTSFQAKLAAKIEKSTKKFGDKKLKARHERIKKHFAARKAKKAAKGKKTGKK